MRTIFVLFYLYDLLEIIAIACSAPVLISCYSSEIYRRKTGAYPWFTTAFEGLRNVVVVQLSVWTYLRIKF